ncbi:MAG: hypothetical protein CBC82_02940 [Cellvibrionales bacterium TMED122]|nr:hypothetical protein [Halieaceae bacterium]OUV64891.1 MAG: hypothetical protein CBC82_02940 [Cellvibrionales bacterium TMED122]
MAIDLDPNDVEAFLRANPNFLQDRPGLLAVLNLPHGGEGAVSLVERQVSVLRERNIASRQKINALSDIGRENDRLLEATRRTVLALLSGVNRQELAKIWREQLTETFKAELGTLVWITGEPNSDSSESVAGKLIRQGESFSGVLRPEEMKALFAIDASEGSAALSPIRAGSEILGVLAVGARDSQRYRQEDGTLFLDYLAEVIGQLPGSHVSSTR